MFLGQERPHANHKTILFNAKMKGALHGVYVQLTAGTDLLFWP